MSVRRFPVATLALVASALVVRLSPALQRWLVLDRSAVAAGQLWRVATGSLVHFSAAHLALDLVAVAVAGWILERNGRRIGGVLVAAMVAVGLAVLRFAPGVAVYGGLSGVAYTLVALCALDAVGRGGTERAPGLAAIVLLAAKLCWEIRSGAFVFVADAGDAFVPVPVSHVAGLCVGVAAFLMARSANHRTRIARILPSSRARSVSGSTHPAA